MASAISQIYTGKDAIFHLEARRHNMFNSLCCCGPVMKQISKRYAKHWIELDASHLAEFPMPEYIQTYLHLLYGFKPFRVTSLRSETDFSVPLLSIESISKFEVHYSFERKEQWRRIYWNSWDKLKIMAAVGDFSISLMLFSQPHKSKQSQFQYAFVFLHRPHINMAHRRKMFALLRMLYHTIVPKLTKRTQNNLIDGIWNA